MSADVVLTEVFSPIPHRYLRPGLAIPLHHEGRWRVSLEEYDA
jgi:hypothetical protein